VSILSPSDESLAHAAALEFLQSRLNYERTPAVVYSERAYKLERISELLSRIGNPERQLRVVHVAGTKGKGSTAAMIASMLTAAGLRVGLFSSPHLFEVEERLAIDGQSCTADELVELVDLVAPHVEAMVADARRASALPADPLAANYETETASATATYDSGGPTYFEITTAMALAHFVRRKVDVAVLEVGLGGRLDSTNVCQPVVSVITSISYDHVHELGPTLPQIAAEKAGIIKPTIPVISGVANREPRDVIREKCAQERSPLWELDRDFHFVYSPPRHMEKSTVVGEIDYRGPNGASLSGLRLGLIGRHQAANAAVALATIYRLREVGMDVDEAAIRRGLATVACPARVQVMSRRPTIVVDTAHNVASVQALVATLGESFAARKRYLIFATTRDKDALGMLQVLLPHFDEVVLTRYVSNPRGFAPQDLAAAAAEARPELIGRTHLCPTPAEALAHLRARIEPEDLLCIAGSFFLAADVHVHLSCAHVGYRESHSRESEA
jgi:dihydrofolate synthase/folylpolyglutamate synthase